MRVAPGLPDGPDEAGGGVAAARGASLLWLGTHVTNKRAQKAYKRAGFRQVGTRTYNVGGQDAHDVVMTRRTGEGL